MTLPRFAANAAKALAWAMTSPEERAAELIRFTAVATADPSTINRWAEALSRLQAFSADHGGPSLSKADYDACVEWLSAAYRSSPEAMAEAKRAVFDEALRLHQT